MRSFVKRITPERLKIIYRSLRGKILGLCFGLFGHFPIKQDRVVFENVWGYGDNPKSIALALRKLDRESDRKPDGKSDRKSEIIFITGGGRKTLSRKDTKGIRFVASGSIRAVFFLATARVWIDCNHKPYYVRKRSGQFYMQTWHGSLPLKRIEYDAEGLSEEYLEEAAHDTGLADVFLSDSEFCNDIYRHAFGYKGKIVITGSPRLDGLLKNGKSRRTAILGRIGTNPKKRVALYAPTFRENGENAGPLGAFNAKKICAALKERFGKEFVMLVKLHPLAISHGCSCADMGAGVTDVSSYPDIYELLEAADVLITDYSNTMFEFSYTGKPCFLFAPDSEQYKDERGMYFVYDRLPFPIAKTSAELCEKIKTCDMQHYAAQAQAFYRDLGVREDGRASKRAAQIIRGEVRSSDRP